jgi:negative regulator of flagellin synthesis FlgM
VKVNGASGIGQVNVVRPAESKATRSGFSAVASDKVSTDSSTQVVAAGAATREVLANQHGLRLEAITQAVKDGTFKPDPQRVAQKILDDAELTAMLQTMLHRG